MEANRKLIDADVYKCADNESIILEPLGNITVERRGLQRLYTPDIIEKDEITFLERLFQRNVNRFTVARKQSIEVLVEVEAQ